MVNQLQYHVGMGSDPNEIRSYLASHNITMQAYSPLGDNTTELITGNLTTSIGQLHNKSSVQVALRFLIQSGVPLVTKSDSLIHLADDIDLFSWELSDEEMTELYQAKTPAGEPSFRCTA